MSHVRDVSETYSLIFWPKTREALNMCFKKICFLFIILVSHATAADVYSLYADKIYELENHGHIKQEDAQQRVQNLQLDTPDDRETLKKQARGVASAISQKKIITIVNEPIEVSLTK